MDEWRMQSLISAATEQQQNKKTDVRQSEKDSGRDVTVNLEDEERANTRSHTFEMPPRDSLNQNRSRGWCWFRPGCFFCWAGHPSSSSGWILLDTAAPITTWNQKVDGHIIHFLSAKLPWDYKNSLHQWLFCFVLFFFFFSRRGWIPPQLFLLSSVSFWISCRTYRNHIHQSSKWRRLFDRLSGSIPQVNEQASINIIYLCFVSFFPARRKKNK